MELLNTTRRVLFKLLHRAVAKSGQDVVQRCCAAVARSSQRAAMCCAGCYRGCCAAVAMVLCRLLSKVWPELLTCDSEVWPGCYAGWSCVGWCCAGCAGCCAMEGAVQATAEGVVQGPVQGTVRVVWRVLSRCCVRWCEEAAVHWQPPVDTLVSRAVTKLFFILKVFLGDICTSEFKCVCKNLCNPTF